MEGILDILGINYESMMICRSCWKPKQVSKFKKEGKYYRCSCTALIDSRGKVIDYGERDLYRLAQKVKVEGRERSSTKYDISCHFCGAKNYISVGNKWFTCKSCRAHQSTGIMCTCGKPFIPTNNTWAYKCVHCGIIVDIKGETISRRKYLICGCCREPVYKEISKASVGVNNNIYKCVSCSAYNDSRGKQLFHEDLCTCKECDTLFERERSRYRGNKMPIGTIYKCPGCNSYLDFTGNCTEIGTMDKCNSCNITFSRITNANHPWLLQCPSCYEYVDNNGDILGARDIGICKSCNTKQPKSTLEDGCALCGYTEVTNGELVCTGCGTLYNDDDLMGRACQFCGSKIIRNE